MNEMESERLSIRATGGGAQGNKRLLKKRCPDPDISGDASAYIGAGGLGVIIRLDRMIQGSC